MNPTKNQKSMNKNSHEAELQADAKDERLQTIDDALLDNCSGGVNEGICNGHQFCVYCQIPPQN
ncbi:hypothetical protein [Shewanella marina]|uniref:hypothetical protein n=1 Tax=Shewanella marina TaxID=487319 RepID=UPI00046FAEE9|nr:hypothetical protein [Shewanella marina]